MPLHRQPWKFHYLIYLAIKVVVKLPFWTLLSIPRSRRPRSSWSLGRCLRLYLYQTVLGLPFKLILSKRYMTSEIPDSELPNSKFVWVEGVEEKSIQGPVRVWAKIANVKPTRISGYWQFKEGTPTTGTLQAKDDEKVVYNLHGGAFVVSVDMLTIVYQSTNLSSGRVSTPFRADGTDPSWYIGEFHYHFAQLRLELPTFCIGPLPRRESFPLRITGFHCRVSIPD